MGHNHSWWRPGAPGGGGASPGPQRPFVFSETKKQESRERNRKRKGRCHSAFLTKRQEFRGGRTALRQTVLEQLGPQPNRNKHTNKTLGLDLHLTPYTEINSKCIADFQAKFKTLRHLEDCTEEPRGPRPRQSALGHDAEKHGP